MTLLITTGKINDILTSRCNPQHCCSPLKCDITHGGFIFSSRYCRFQNPNQAEGALTFARGSGETSTPLTGPSGDSSAPGDGYYMYSEATGVGTEVKLELRVNHTFCSQGVTFW